MSGKLKIKSIFKSVVLKEKREKKQALLSQNRERSLEPTFGILLVEDEAIIRHFVKVDLEYHLDKYQYQFYEAANGVEALDIIGKDREKKIKIIILDLKMDKMGGLELLNILNRSERDDIGVIIVTAYGDNEAREKAMFYRAIGFFEKLKIDPKKLADLIVNYLENYITSAPRNTRLEMQKRTLKNEVIANYEYFRYVDIEGNPKGVCLGRRDESESK